MSADSENSLTHFFSRLREDDNSVAEQLWNRYCPRLTALARRTLAGQPKTVADENDAVQSAMVSFWRRSERGDFSADMDSNELWNLLGLITVRKARKQIRKENTQKRGGGKVVREGDLADFRLDEILAEMPTQQFDLQCEELLAELDDELRAFALLRLMGHKNREIADIYDCTERRIERKMQLIRLQWQNEFPM